MQGSSTSAQRDGQIDILLTKFRPIIDTNDNVPTIDKKIKDNFARIKNDIVADLNDTRTELDELLADKNKMDKFVEDTLAHLKNTSDNNPNQFVSADDLLANIDTGSILNRNESAKFKEIIGEEFDKEADK